MKKRMRDNSKPCGSGRIRAQLWLPCSRPATALSTPRGCPTCPASAAGLERRAQSSRAPHPRASQRARARSHPRSQLTHFKVHSQNSQTFPSPMKRKPETLPSPSKGLRAWCPLRMCDSINFSLQPADVMRGVGERGPIWGGAVAPREVKAGRGEEQRGFYSRVHSHSDRFLRQGGGNFSCASLQRS